MATLEKIRSKSVLLIVVIGVALLAFIVGDALTNSQNLFGDHTTVAKIGGEKIDYHEYQRKREELNNQLEEARRQNPQQVAGFDVQTLSQMAIEQLVSEKLIDDAADKAGIKTSDNLLSYYVLTRPVSPTMQTIMQQLNASGISAATPQQAHEVIFNPKRNGLTEAQMEPFQRAWIAMEEETRQLVKRQIYQRLVVNTVKANDLDKKALYDDYVSTSSVDYAFLPFGTLDEKKYPVSDAELKEAYDKEKNRFKVDEETKEISFIAVSIVPSEADRKAAKELARTAAASLRDSAGTISKQLRKEGLSLDRNTLLASAVPAGPVKTFLASAPKDSVSIVSETLQGFTIVKMGNRTTAVDSIFVDVVQVAGKTLPGKVLAALNGGLNIDSVASRFSADSVFVQSNQGIALYGPNGPTQAMQESQLDTLRQNAGRYITLMDSEGGAVLAKLVKQTSPKEVYEFEEVNYVLGPSSKTVSDERAKLEKFLAANANSKDFTANAAKSGYNVQRYVVSQSTPAIPRVMGMNYYYPDSRQVMRWVMMEGETGNVSHIYESKDAVNPAIYAVAVDQVYDDYMPVTNAEVKNYLTDKVRRSKAGDDLVKQYKPKAQSLQSAAQAMGVEPQNTAAFRFGNANSVRDAGVMGRINGSAADKKVVVVKGNDGVYVYQVMGKNTEKFPYNEDMYEQQYFQVVNPQLGDMLKGKKTLENNVYKFEAGD